MSFNHEVHEKILYHKESYAIMGACFEVYEQMGVGFLESVYQVCLEKELQLRSIRYKREVAFEIKYKGSSTGQQFIADFICYDSIILELKSVKALLDIHRAQVHNYLKATQLNLGILLNFSHYPKLEWERIIV